MKIFKYYIHWVLAITLMMVFTGCDSNLLDTTPKDEIAPETFYQNENEAVMGLMGVYNSMNYLWYQHDFMSDNNYMHHDWQGSMVFANWNHDSQTKLADGQIIWDMAYRTIGRANAFLEDVQEAPLDDQQLNQLTAEARFIRAQSYAYLVFYYGDVPLITEKQLDPAAENPRVPKEEVKGVIIDDFDYAADHLPLAHPHADAGRATRGAALALKARFLLYEEDYPEAAQAAQEVIDLQEYELFPDYDGLFDEENQNNQEIIFDIQYMPDDRPQPWPSTCLGYSEWPTPGVTIDIVEEFRTVDGLPIDDPDAEYDPQDPFTDRDPRLNASFVLPGTPYGDISFVPANDQVPTGMRPRKYAGIELDDKNNCSVNWIIMRYADVLLIRAEALIESGETGQEVYDLINQVRQRVDMPTIEEVDGTGLSQNELRELLRHERRVEFAMEGTRYSDMKRWELEEAVGEVYGWNTDLLADPDNPDEWVFEEQRMEDRNFDPAKGWLWPIPLEEINSNDAISQDDQNPGY